MDQNKPQTRRQYMRGLGAAGTVGLAGCGDAENGGTTDEYSTDEETTTDDTGDDEIDGPEFNITIHFPDETVIGDPEAVITIENTGDAAGSYEGNYIIENGETIEQEIITDELEPGNSQEIGLEEVLEELEPGQHQIEIDNETYDFNLLLDWSWEDALQSEYQWAVNNSERVIDWNEPDRTFWDVFETEEFRQSVRNGEFPERLEETHPLIIDFADQMMDETGDPSSVFSNQIHPITKRIYIEEEEKSRPSMGYTAGHGYNYKDNKNDSLWLTDSNWPVKGPVEDRVLRDRPNSRSFDIIGSTFVDDNGNLAVDFEDLNQREAISFNSLPTRWLNLRGYDLDNNPFIAVHPSVSESYNRDILEGEDSELYWNRARPALLALNYASERGLFEESAFGLLNIPIDELPEFKWPVIGRYDEDEEQVYLDEQVDRQEFTDYIMDLKEDIEFIEAEEEYFDMLGSKAGQ